MNGQDLSFPPSGGKHLCFVCVMFCLLLFMFAGCATTSVWQRWSPDEQKRYFGLTFIEEDTILAQYRSLPDQESRDAWYKTYWAAKDPDGSLLAEHRSRLDRAWREFGGRMFFRDGRSGILIRYGPPEKETGNQPFLHALGNKQLAGGTYIKERAWVIWEYPSQGRCYDLLLEDGHFQLVADVYSDKLHPVAFFAADTFHPGEILPNKAQQPLACEFGRFRSADGGRVRWEIYWRIPAPRNSQQGEGRRYLGIFDLHGKDGLISSDTLGYRLEYTGDELLRPQAYGQRNTDLPPGRYKMKIQLRSQPGDTVYAGEMETELVGYRSGVREASDVEMAVLQDSTYVSSDFRKDKYRRVISAVSGKINRYQPFYVYYEVYSLATDAAGEHQVTVGHGIYLSDTTGSLKECIVDTRDLFYQDAGDYLSACHKVHPMALEPGEYILVIDVKDLISGRLSKITHRFEIQDGQEFTARPPEDKNKAIPDLRPPRKPLRR